MNIKDQIENQFNPIIIATDIKIKALIQTLDKEQYETYKAIINERKTFIQESLNEHLTDEQLQSILILLD